MLTGKPALGLQKVSEPRAGKDRVHLDLHTDHRAAEVARLIKLGASVLAEGNAPGLWWTVLGRSGRQRILRRQQTGIAGIRVVMKIPER